MKFTEAIRNANRANFTKENPNAISMLEEIRGRIPWQRWKVDHLLSKIEKYSKLTAEELSKVTDMYLNCCATSDADIIEQVGCRKLCIRLLDTRLGKVHRFVESVADNTSFWRFSPAQMRAIRNIAYLKRQELGEVPHLDESTFDGWYKIAEPKPVLAHGWVLTRNWIKPRQGLDKK